MTARAPNRVRIVLLGIAADENFAGTPALEYAAGLGAGTARSCPSTSFLGSRRPRCP